METVWKYNAGSEYSGDKKFYVSEQERAVIYYIYPKTQDIQKLLIMPIGIVGGYITLRTEFGRNDFRLSMVIVAYICFEVLLYTARYHFNDIRGMKEYLECVGGLSYKLRDEENYKGIPIIYKNIDDCINLGSGILMFKLVMSFILMVVCWMILDFNPGLWICYILIITVTLAYENARKSAFKVWKSTKRSDSKYKEPEEFEKSNKRVFALVGFGYPLRFFAGVFAANNRIEWINSNIVVIMLLFVGLYFYGVMCAMIPSLYNAVMQAASRKRRKNIESIGDECSIRFSKSYYEYMYNHLDKEYQDLFLIDRECDAAKEDIRKWQELLCRDDRFFSRLFLISVIVLMDAIVYLYIRNVLVLMLGALAIGYVIRNNACEIEMLENLCLKVYTGKTKSEKNDGKMLFAIFSVLTFAVMMGIILYRLDIMFGVFVCGVLCIDVLSYSFFVYCLVSDIDIKKVIRNIVDDYIVG